MSWRNNPKYAGSSVSERAENGDDGYRPSRPVRRRAPAPLTNDPAVTAQILRAMAALCEQQPDVPDDLLNLLDAAQPSRWTEPQRDRALEFLVRAANSAGHAWTRPWWNSLTPTVRIAQLRQLANEVPA